MKHSHSLGLLAWLLGGSLMAAELPAYRADFAHGTFNPFEDVSGKWEETATGLQEFSDDPGADSVTRTKKIHFGANTALTVVTQPHDSMGTSWIDFGVTESGDGFRLVHDVATAVQVSLYRLRGGKVQLLASVDNSALPLDGGDAQTPLQFKIQSSADAVQVQLNTNKLFCIRCNDMPSGGVALGVRGRKQEFKLINAKTYPKLTLTMQPTEIQELEFCIRHKALRHSFYRDETPEMQIVFANRTTAEVTAEAVSVQMPDKSKVSLAQTKVAPGQEYVWRVPVNGALFEGECQMSVEGKASGKALTANYPLFFGERPAPDAFIMASWNGSPQPSFLDFLHQNGANGSNISVTPYDDFEKIRKVTAAVHDAAIRNNTVLKVDFPVLDIVDPAKRHLTAIAPDGKYTNVLNCNLPEAQAYAVQCGETLARFLLDYPAFRSILLSSEVENFLSLSCGKGDKARYETLFGHAIPQLQTKSAVLDNTDGVTLNLPDEVKKQTPSVVPANNLWYQWLTFLWKKGFGDNLLHAKVAAAMKAINPALEMGHDPFRDYPVFDRNIGLDYYGTWFYPTPDAGESFMAIESMLAAIAGGGNRQKMQFGASLWLYSYQFCPARDRQAGVQPETIYMETLFLGLAARPDKFELFSYNFLLPDCKLEYKEATLLANLKKFSETMAEPIWAATRPMQRETRPVSLLLSSAGQIFGAQQWGGYGYCADNAMLNLLWKANLPANIIFEDTIRQNDDWKQSKLLVIATAQHLPEDVFKAIKAYAKAGGKVLACAPFDKLIPGADSLAIDFDFSTKASYYTISGGSPWTALKAQEYRLAEAAKLRRKYHRLVTPFADSDSVELYLRTLQDSDSRFVFALNDKRTEGEHMGKKFHAVLDAGMPQSAAIKLAMNTGAVYEFPAGKRLQTVAQGGQLAVKLEFAPVEGKILLCYPEALGKLTLTAKRDYTAEIALTDDAGQPFRGTVPVRVEWLDSTGKTRMQYHAIRNGKLQVSVRPGSNLPVGKWRCKVTELASGMTAEAEF